MNPHEKALYDRLVAAGWLDNVTELQGGKRIIRWCEGSVPADNGGLKLILFSKLCQDLFKAGPFNVGEVELLTSWGEALSQGKG